MKEIIGKEDSMLLVIDIQDKLINNLTYPIYEKDRIIGNTRALIKAANIYGLPVLVTEQRKLGETIPEIKELLMEYDFYHPVRKLSFSCYRDGGFRGILKEVDRSTVILCGIEAHICVAQTALDLMVNGYVVHVVEDATSAYPKENYVTAINRLRDAGAVITGTEMLVYELLREAGTDEFRGILEVVKERRDSTQMGGGTEI